MAIHYFLEVNIDTVESYELRVTRYASVKLTFLCGLCRL